MINIHREETGPATVLRVQGEFDEDGAYALYLSLLTCIKQRRTKVVVNLSEVRYIPYLAMGVLLERLCHFRRYGGNLKLAGIDPGTRLLFRRTGVSNVIEIHDTEFQAVQGFCEAAA